MVRSILFAGLGAAALALALSPAGRAAADDKQKAPILPSKVRPKAEVEETRNDAWKVTVEVDRSNATYSVNDAVTITVTSAEKGYLYVVNANEAGNIFYLFPNEFQSNAEIAANTAVVIPAPNNPKKFQFRADKSGKEIIKAIVTKEPLSSVDVKDLASRAVTKSDRTKFVRLVTEALGGDPTKIPQDDPNKPQPVDTKPDVVVQKQKIEIEQPEVYKKKKKMWATGDIVITIVDTQQKPDQKPDQKDKPNPNPKDESR